MQIAKKLLKYIRAAKNSNAHGTENNMFTPATFDFLVENRIQNSRTWYAEHKNDFQSKVFEPLKELTNELAPFMKEVDSLIVTEPKTDRAISRVYRDTRFSKDKALYRDNMWLTFKRDKNAYPHFPEFYFVITPDGFFYGCGYYAATPAAVDSLRELILSDDRSFKKALASYNRQSVFTLEGDMYKRTRYPEQTPQKREWLDRKNISVSCGSKDFQLLYSASLGEKLIEDYSLLKDVYSLFIKAEELKR